MLTDELDDPTTLSADELRRRYERELADRVRALGVDRVRAATDLDAATIRAVQAGDAGTVDLADVAAILALADEAPDAEAVLLAVRDHLLLSMSTAMLTVDDIAADLDRSLDLDPKEIQAKIEGRLPIRLDEYAAIHHTVAVAGHQ